jgi:dipeptidyl aminopeptidase/acylaminoacyl peptidase
MPKNALGIMNVSTGKVTRIDRVKRFQIPEEGGGFVAYLHEAKTPERRPESGAPGAAGTEERRPPEAGAGPGGGPGTGRRPGARRKEFGTDLVVRNLSDNTERTFAEVLDFSISDDGKSLVYSVSSRQEEQNGAFAITPLDAAMAPRALLKGKGQYTRFTWDENGTQLAFTSDRDDAAAKQPKFKLYYWDRVAPEASEIVSVATAGFRKGMVISERGPLSFSLTGNRIFFGVQPPPEPEREEEAGADDEERVVVDLWHWNDDFIQPMQKVRATQDRNRSYRAVYHIKEKKLVQLADQTLESINPSSDGLWAIGSDDRIYRKLVGVDTNYSDFYLVNTVDGSRKALLKKQQFGANWSPSGRWTVYYDGKDWHSLSVPDGRDINLTKSLGVSFAREDHDSPSTPFNYGTAGWTKDEKFVLLNDRYDIWQVAADGSGAKVLTDGVGRREKIVFRYVRLDPKERAIDPLKSMLLSAENEWTRDSGFYRDRIGGGLPEKVIMEAKDFSSPVKARNADRLLFTATRFEQFPDLLVSGLEFKDIRKISNANPQMSQFVWGKAELVRFKNSDGVALSGVLIKPDNFDPAKKYPMMVYIYEQLSQGLHRFVNPSPGTSINPTFYASNGYIVFMPDIVYTIGYPGQSALKCVLPGIQEVVNRGFVDEKAIGIQGHSWGGYQIAYMVTQTNRFRAAAPGALVANMTSAYSGIRWGSGLPRQFQYEHTQSRIGGSLWEQPMRYLENSPVFRADRVETPILMLHNDADDAVPWYQGIEYYLALRRLGKEVYMFNYNGEPHGLRKRANQKDYTRRMQQFFDHYLKGAPTPAWMEKGIPFIEREKEKEQYRAPAKAAAAASGNGGK